MSPRVINIAVFISGDGTNLQRIIDDIKNNILKNCKICVVVSNKLNAYGLYRAKKQNIITSYFPFLKDKEERSGYDKLLAYSTLSYTPDIVVLAGWMHILSDNFLQHLPHIINLHPALPGQFPGNKAIENAYKASREWYKNKDAKKTQFMTGAMCHKVIEKIDAGEVLASESFAIRPEDTITDVKTKMKIVEKDVLMAGLLVLINQIRECDDCDGDVYE